MIFFLVSSLGFGWTLCQSHLPPADALLLRDCRQADTLLFSRGIPQVGCVDSFSSAVDLQSYLQMAECPDIQSCDERCWALLHFLAEDPKTAKTRSKHPTFLGWSSKPCKPQLLSYSTTMKLLAGGNSREICKTRAK